VHLEGHCVLGVYCRNRNAAAAPNSATMSVQPQVHGALVVFYCVYEPGKVKLQQAMSAC
jgi:hypothetical protein